MTQIGVYAVFSTIDEDNFFTPTIKSIDSLKRFATLDEAKKYVTQDSASFITFFRYQERYNHNKAISYTTQQNRYAPSDRGYSYCVESTSNNTEKIIDRVTQLPASIEINAFDALMPEQTFPGLQKTYFFEEVDSASAAYTISEFDFNVTYAMQENTASYKLLDYQVQLQNITPKKTQHAAEQFLNDRIALFSSNLGYSDYKFTMIEQYADSSKYIQNLQSKDIIHSANQAKIKSFPIDDLAFVDIRAASQHSLRKVFLTRRFLIERA